MVYYGYIVQICESIQSDVPGFYYTERDFEDIICDEIRNVIYGSALKHQTTTNPDFNFHCPITHSSTPTQLAQINETL